jgi:hypothetical protein
VKKVERVIHSTSLYKLEHLVSNDCIPVVPERNLNSWCQILVAFYRTEDEGVKEIHTSPNLLHSSFPHRETHIESHRSQDPPYGYRHTDVCQHLFSNKNQN